MVKGKQIKYPFSLKVDIKEIKNPFSLKDDIKEKYFKDNRTVKFKMYEIFDIIICCSE